MSDPEDVAGAPQRRVRVWDGVVRVSHWTLVLSVSLAWLTTLLFGWTGLHRPAGYAALAAALLRVLWGFIGSRPARFRQFLRAPREVVHYVRELRAGREQRYLGHNPLGGWMAATLLAVVTATGFSGWLFTTDMFWGMPWLARLHAVLAWSLLALVVLHVAGVAAMSRRQSDNLLAAMIDGRKPRRRIRTQGRA